MDEQKIYDKLDVIAKDVAEIKMWVGIHKEQHKSITKWIQSTDNTLFHNEGVADKVKRLWSCKENLKERKSIFQKFYLYIIKALIVAIILGFAAWFFKTYGIFKI